MAAGPQTGGSGGAQGAAVRAWGCELIDTSPHARVQEKRLLSPRATLSTRARDCSRSSVSFFISSRMTPQLSELLRGLPHGIVLENVQGDLAFLVPARLPARCRATGRS